MSQPLPESMAVEDLQQWRTAGTVHTLLDVREPRELAVCAVAGALAIPMQEIPARLADLPRDRPIVVMCHHGMRSRMVAQFLRAQGFTGVINLDGGIDAWAGRIDPLMQRY